MGGLLVLLIGVWLVTSPSKPEAGYVMARRWLARAGPLAALLFFAQLWTGIGSAPFGPLSSLLFVIFWWSWPAYWLHVRSLLRRIPDPENIQAMRLCVILFSIGAVVATGLTAMWLGLVPPVSGTIAVVAMVGVLISALATIVFIIFAFTMQIDLSFHIRDVLRQRKVSINRK